MKLKYHNVGCIEDAEVEYKPGQLVAIVGESNQGKSLQFYSLLAGFINTSDFKRYINNEALSKNPKTYESIELIDDTGKSWSVVATTTSLAYKVGEVKYEKTNRKNIFELTNSQIPGLLYDPENCTPIMNIVDEDSGMFPIDRSDAQIFKTYERLLSLSCTEDILRAIKLDIEDIDYNVTDRLKAIQQNQSMSIKLSELLSSIDESELSSIIVKCETFKQKSSELNNLYNTTKKTVNYVSEALKIKIDKTDFDVKTFQSKLELLLRANNTLQYCTKANQIVVKSCQDFNVENIIKQSQNLSQAIQLSKDIAYLQYQISIDEDGLKGIQNILKTIKTCPLCGHKLED